MHSASLSMLIYRSVFQLSTSPNRRQQKQRERIPPLLRLSLCPHRPLFSNRPLHIYIPTLTPLLGTAGIARHPVPQLVPVRLSRNGEGREEEVWLGRHFARSFGLSGWVANQRGGTGRGSSEETPIPQRHQTAARRPRRKALLRSSEGPECAHRKVPYPRYTPDRRTSSVVAT